MMENSIVTNFKTKSIGFYITLVAVVLTIAQFVVYAVAIGADPENDIYNASVLIWAPIAIVAFAVLTTFKPTSALAPIPLMACSLLSVASFVNAGGLIDYVSTIFFDGITIDKIFSMPAAIWFSVLSFVLTFVIASVGMYLRQNKKDNKANSKEVQDEQA